MVGHPTVRTWPTRLLARPWFLAFVPINAATACFGVALPLLILVSLGGTWSDVAIAATLFNAAVIVSSILWGVLADRFPGRRAFLLVNFGGFAALYAALAFAHTLPVLFGIYAAVGFLAPAGANASNLLILEAFPDAERPNAFASFQEMSILGGIGGLLLGFFWTLDSRPLEPLLIILAALAAASFAAVYFVVQNPRRAESSAAIAKHPEGLVARLHHTGPYRVPIPFFPKRPAAGPGAFRRFARWSREEVRHELPLILAASFLFNLTANLFNISYTPYLYSAGLASSAIFLVNLGNNAAQAVAFPLSGSTTQAQGAQRVVVRATYVRSLGYLAVGAFTLSKFAPGTSFGANAVIYALLGGAIAFYSTSSSIRLFRALHERDAGGLLGLNSALGGVAAVAGSVLAGGLSVVGSFSVTFLISGVALLASIPLWVASELARARGGGELLGRTAVLRAPTTGPVTPSEPSEARVRAGRARRGVSLRLVNSHRL